MATRVLEAAAPLPVAVVCDDAEVAAWAVDNGAMALPEPGRGLNGAVEAGVARLAALGATEVLVAHADLPLAHGLAAPGGLRRRDPRARSARRRHQRGLRPGHGDVPLPLRSRDPSPATGPRRGDGGCGTGSSGNPDLAWDVDVPADIPAEFVPPARL